MLMLPAAAKAILAGVVARFNNEGFFEKGLGFGLFTGHQVRPCQHVRAIVIKWIKIKYGLSA